MFVFLSSFSTEDIIIVLSNFMFDQNVGGVQVGEGWTSNFSLTMDDSYIFSFFKKVFVLACSDLCCTCCLAAVKLKPLFIKAECSISSLCQIFHMKGWLHEKSC